MMAIKISPDSGVELESVYIIPAGHSEEISVDERAAVAIYEMY